MDLEIKITTQKNQTTINYEVQSPINQVLKDRIREKKDRFKKKRKKKHYLNGTKLECSI
jgi:hypothetical protein